MNISVILSGGIGVRFGAELPKQYQLLVGREVIGYAVDAINQAAASDKLIIVAAEDDIQRLKSTYGIECAKAGNTHNASVKSGLDYIRLHYPGCRKVLFADAARPFLETKTVERYFAVLDDNDAVITTQKITDSLGKEGSIFVDRAEYFLIQKPEAFRFDLLYSSFSINSTATAIVQQMPYGSRIHKCFDQGKNLKVTYPDDLLLAEYLMEIQQRRRS